VEARVVKEGDEFGWTEGTEPSVTHVPSLASDRSSKPTTHVYAVATLRSGATQIDVADRSAIERIRLRGKQKAFSPWDTDWDEMGKKTIVKRLGKLLPVEPEVRAMLAREDELPAGDPSTAPAALPRTSRTAALAARLSPEPPPAQDAPQAEEAAFRDVDATPDPAAAPDPTVCGSVAPDGLMAGSVCSLPAHDKGPHKSDTGSWPR
jgi:recombination protein RecT